MKVKEKKSPERDEVDGNMKVKRVFSPIFVSPSKTRIPVGVRPKLKEKSVKTILNNKTANTRIPEDPRIIIKTETGFVIPLTYTLIHPFQALYAYPPRTSPGFLPCSRRRALPGLEFDPYKKVFDEIFA